MIFINILARSFYFIVGIAILIFCLLHQADAKTKRYIELVDMDAQSLTQGE